MRRPGGAVPDVRQVRDLSVWSDGAGRSYVVACDANAGIGLRDADFLRREPEDVGYSAAKVPLMEICAAGATPLLVVNTLCLPLPGYGSRIVAGIRRAVAETGSPAPITGSDETNMTTVQTGVGVTVIGVTSRLLLGMAQPGDLVVCAGYPRSGLPDAPYAEGDHDVAAPRDVMAVADNDVVHEILPVGSKGVLAEVRQLAETAGLDFELADDVSLPMTVSAGASTCFLVACPPDGLDTLKRATRLPLSLVATLHER